jgi:hypothetical protein
VMVNWRVDNVMSGDIGLFGSPTSLGWLKEAPDERANKGGQAVLHCSHIREHWKSGNYWLYLFYARAATPGQKPDLFAQRPLRFK